jgi:5'-methylthioadenosine phosphorylase
VTKLGVIGGSGLYDIEEMTDVRKERVETPFGNPSDNLILGRVGDREIVFLPRHGVGHYLNPTEVPYRANIHAMKQLGVTHLLSVSAVGSLIERYPPLTLVCPDQIIDRTVHRDRTFFEHGVVAHVGIAHPFCPDFTSCLVSRAADAGITVERGGTYIAIEGPQFSTIAESELYRSWGAAVIGMTAMPEARLAREAELHYVQLAMVTDFDVWHEDEGHVSVEKVVEYLHRNAANAKQVVRSLLNGGLDWPTTCNCPTALANAIITAPDRIPAEQRKRLSVIAGKYFKS